MIVIYSPRVFGQMIGRSVKRLQKWDRAETLTAHRSPTNRRYYMHDQYLKYRGPTAQGGKRTIVYARVSRARQKPDLVTQVAALKDYCERRQFHPDEWVEEIGSGLKYQRKHFNQMMEEIELGRVSWLVIAHQDRLVRFGCEWFVAFCERHGTELVIVNGGTLPPEQELVQDLLSTVHVFSARLYGLRSSRKAIRDAAQ